MKRSTLAYALLAVAMTALLVPFPAAPEAGPAVVQVRIDGPDAVVWSGLVTADPGTAYGALLAAGRTGGFEVQATGHGSTTYVTSIAGHGESGAGGWCLQVDEGSGWQDSPRSGAVYVLRSGWAVRWYWADAGCNRF